MPVIARTSHGTAPGWPPTAGVIERTFAWLYGFQRLRIRPAELHEALLKLACYTVQRDEEIP